MMASISRRCQAFACVLMVFGLYVYWRHVSMPVVGDMIVLVDFEGPSMVVGGHLGPSMVVGHLRPRWAIATLITMSAMKGLGDHAITYTHQAMLLAYQIHERYPDVPLLAVVLEEQVGKEDIKLLESAGYQILLRASLTPAYVTSKQMLAHVYYDQYMKFWLWYETDYEYIVYIDSDTFFRDAMMIDFPASFSQVSEEQVVACPTPWSHATPEHLPTTWNGGFFIMKPSIVMFERLVSSRVMPEHFLKEYGPDKQWFDVSEMGAFMRQFPAFSMPGPVREDYCSEIQWCCVEAKCQTRYNMTVSMGNMIHGLKPDGQRNAGAPPSSIFDNQRLNAFASWGYDPACLLSGFYEPLAGLYVEHGLLV